MIEHIRMMLEGKEIAISTEDDLEALNQAVTILAEAGAEIIGRTHSSIRGPFDRYNGWPNYETWDIKLWIDNDRQLYSETQELVMEAGGRAGAADAIKELFEALNPLAEDANTFSDMMTHALGQVDWFKIADSIAEDLGRAWE